mmetsp:Transcript_59893/g.194102  ORF Transcript_59893/g.194102 Transcript_59893/m.194102 type:complete len:571 (-) Transcript_59893:111-1823(-)
MAQASGEAMGRRATMWGVVKRNPEMVKAIIAAGVERSAVMVASTMVIQNVKAMVWKDSLTEYNAILSMIMNILAMLSGPWFGRFGDRCGRRVAALVFGLCSFLPAWSLIAFGPVFGFDDPRVLWAVSAASVLSAFALSSDATLVLTNEVTREEDRGMAFGLFQALTSGIAFILCGLPVFLFTTLKVADDAAPLGLKVMPWLAYQVLLSVIYFFTVMTVRVPPMAAAANASQEEMATEADVEGQASETKAREVVKEKPKKRNFAGNAWKALLSSFELAFQSRSLKLLYLTSVAMFFSGDVVYDLGGQYFRDELGYMQGGSTLEQQQMVSVLSTVTPLVFVIPANAFVGHLAQRMGSLRLLQIMIPFAATCTASGAFMALAPYVWMIPVVCLAQNFAGLAHHVPLKHLIAESAPEGRVGEAMGTLGTVGQAVSFLANAAVAASTPVMYKYMTKPLWIFYLLAGFLTFIGGIPIWRLSKMNDEEEEEEEPDRAKRQAVRTKTPTPSEFDGEIPCVSPWAGNDSNAGVSFGAMSPSATNHEVTNPELEASPLGSDDVNPEIVTSPLSDKPDATF